MSPVPLPPFLYPVGPVPFFSSHPGMYPPAHFVMPPVPVAIIPQKPPADKSVYQAIVVSRSQVAESRLQEEVKEKSKQNRRPEAKYKSLQIVSTGRCDKEFNRAAKQKRIQQNLREEKFFCKMCPKGFADKTHLARHIRTHTREQPFACPVCDKRFGDKDNCKRHVKKVHNARV